MAFATATELASWMGHDSFDTADTDRAVLLLDAAQGVIETTANQPLESTETTETVDGSGTSRLILRRRPVTAVASVTEDGTPLTVEDDFTWSQSGILTRLGGAWPSTDRSVEAVYTAGFLIVSDDLKRVALELAARAWGSPSGAESEQFGDHNARWGVPGMELTAGQQRIVDRYRSWW